MATEIFCRIAFRVDTDVPDAVGLAEALEGFGYPAEVLEYSTEDDFHAEFDRAL